MILITMAGLSSRFFKAGYLEPKYKLLLNDISVFSHSVLSFKQYFNTEPFVFVVRDVYDTPTFVECEAKKLGIADFKIIILNDETRGQAETAYLALKDYTVDFPIYIFNIDTFRHDYKKPEFIERCDGYLEVFRAEGEHWSFVLPNEQNDVIRTTEKDRISDLCSDGLYYFKQKSVFESLFLDALSHERTVRGEYYIAPLYNELIARGGVVKFDIIELDQIDFCGTPEEYQLLLDPHSASADKR
ncbi:hypothetical protein D3C77_150760 [compost metagenome]